MTFAELHEILDNKHKKLSKVELEEVIYKLKQDCANEVYKRTLGTTDEMMEIQFYNGEQNAFQIALDLLEHLDIKGEHEND